MLYIDVNQSKKYLQALLDSVRTTEHNDFEAFFAEASMLFNEFPGSLRTAVDDLVHTRELECGLLVQGLPTDIDLPPTPLNQDSFCAKKTYASEFWLCSIASRLGEPVAYLQEKNGSIFHHIYPTQHNAEMLSSESSAIELGFHTEIAFHPFTPDYLLLYGLRQDVDKQAVTSFARINEILPCLSAQQRDLLAEPLFQTGIDYSFGSPNATRGNGPLLSILYGDPHNLFMRFDPDLMVGITPEAQVVLDELKQIVCRAQMQVFIEPGTLLVLDNRRCVHARSKFRAYYNGQDRWLQRMFVVCDLSKSSVDRSRYGKRVIATDFSHFLAKSDKRSLE